MKNFTNTIITLVLFFSAQVVDAQHFEYNWQSRDRVGVSKIEASQVDDGWLMVVGGFGRYEVEKYDAQGNLVWNHSPSGFDFWKHNGYTFTSLQNGNYLFTVQGTDCDFCINTGLMVLDEMGQVVAKDTLVSPDTSLRCESFESIVQLTDSTLWMFSFNYFWEYNLNTLKSKATLYEDLGFFQAPTTAWIGKNDLVYLAFEQVLVLDQNKVRIDSFQLSGNLDYGVSMSDSTHLILEYPFVKIINNQGDVLNEWQNPPGQFFADVEIVNDKIITVGAQFSDYTAIFNRFDLDLSNHERYEWGSNYLQTYDLAVQDTIVLIGGEEFSFGGNNYFTPYLKTFNLDDFSTSDCQKEAALESVSIDSLIGEVTGRFVDSDSTIWVNTTSWKFHNVLLKIKNNGMETLNEVTVNWEGSSQVPCTDILNSRKITINLLSGLDTLIVLGDLFDSKLGIDLPEDIELCIWLSAPDELLDAENSNDFVCETFNLKDVSSTDNIFSSNDLEIYPNPSSDFLNIDFKNAELTDSKIQIIDPLGRIVFSEGNKKGVYSKKLNISGLSKGIYFLVLENEKGRVVRRWVKE